MSQLDIILWIQTLGGPALDGIWKAITFLGEEEFFMLALPLLYWCYDATVGVRFVLLVLASAYLNGLLKDAFGTARPSPDQVRVVVQESSPAFPSGHAQNATVFWGFVAQLARRPWVTAAAAVIITLIGISRVALGVHWPVDVVGGLLIGLLLLAGGLWLIQGWERLRLALPALGEIALGLVVPLAFLTITPTDGAAREMGVLAGLLVGYSLMRHTVGSFPTGGTLTQQGIKVVGGVAVLFLLRLALKPLLPDILWAHALRYALMGLWAAWIWPVIIRIWQKET